MGVSGFEWWDLWVQWWQGESVTSESLWGVRVLVWGRVGKIMQFVGALTIIIEIVGPDRWTKLGASLEPFGLSPLVGGNIRDIFILDEVGDPPRDEPTPEEKLMAVYYGLGHVVLPMVLIVAGYLLVGGLLLPVVFVAAIELLAFGWWKRTGDWPSVLSLPLLLLTVAFATIGGAICWLIDKGIIAPLAEVLRHKNVVRLSQVAAVALLVLGFQFDLLAS